MERKINKIIVHCSDSMFGDALAIHAWHKQRGWSRIGYHYVITNGCLEKGTPYNPEHDGEIEVGRYVHKVGAHCKGHNDDSIGLCLIGASHFTPRQVITLRDLLRYLMTKYRVQVSGVLGHNELNEHKSCPGFDMDLVRDLL